MPSENGSDLTLYGLPFFLHAKKNEAVRLRFMPRQRRFIIRRIASYGKAVFHFPPEDEALLYLHYGKKTPISFSIHKSAITDFSFLTDFFIFRQINTYLQKTSY